MTQPSHPEFRKALGNIMTGGRRSRRRRTRRKLKKRGRRYKSRKLGRRRRKRTLRKLYGGGETRRGVPEPQGLGAGRGAQGLGGQNWGGAVPIDEVRRWRGEAQKKLKLDSTGHQQGWEVSRTNTKRRSGRDVGHKTEFHGPDLRVSAKKRQLLHTQFAPIRQVVATPRHPSRSGTPSPPGPATQRPPMSDDQKEFLKGLEDKRAKRLADAQRPLTSPRPTNLPSPLSQFHARMTPSPRVVT